LKTIYSYNTNEVKTDGSLADTGNGYNMWIDLVDPKEEELQNLSKKFNLNNEAVESYLNKSKNPEIRLFDKHTFTIIVDMKNKDPETLVIEPIYFFLGRHWLITIHSKDVNLKELVDKLFNVKNEKIKDAQIDALYYSILAEIVTKYEQLLTALELSVSEYQRRSFAKPMPTIFNEIDMLSIQAIILRRHFWRVRSVVNFLVHREQDKEEIQYIKMVYDEISQLIDFVESFEDTINSIRELYMAKVSLQINDSVRLLTIFTAILLPLSLVAAIYGMNGIDLQNIGTLPNGFFVVIAIMIGIGVGLLLFFIKKQWILSRDNNANNGEYGKQDVKSKIPKTEQSSD
jgi:magnesium transporter